MPASYKRVVAEQDTSAVHDPNPPAVILAGSNDTRIWGMTAATRIQRIAGAHKTDFDGTMIADVHYAFDPEWYGYIAARPNSALTIGGRPALVHTAQVEAASVKAAMESSDGWADGLELHAFESGITVYNSALRKRERPFLMALTPDTVRSIERESYFGAYKGVTDILTKYLWPEWALALTRIAARIGMTPNMVTAIGAALCVWATFLFADGRYWTGMAAALVFMVLDTVDGKLARCTLTASWWGDIFDHGIDLIHPPFWWYAWGIGLGASGLALDRAMFWSLIAILVGGYVLQRLIEGYFIQRIGMHIHVWQKIDTQFRLITARRNPNMVLLFAALVAGRPDMGLVAITVWTLVSLVFHLVRLLQAIAANRDGALQSWLSDGTAR